VSREDWRWLEYRAADASGTVPLGVFRASAARTITAELGRPASLPLALLGGAPARAAERRRIWRYRHEAASRDLGRQVAEAVAAWLAGPHGRTPPNHLGDHPPRQAGSQHRRDPSVADRLGGP
jgi:hypothetical protein